MVICCLNFKCMNSHSVCSFVSSFHHSAFWESPLLLHGVTVRPFLQYIHSFCWLVHICIQFGAIAPTGGYYLLFLLWKYLYIYFWKRAYIRIFFYIPRSRINGHGIYKYLAILDIPKQFHKMVEPILYSHQ